MKTIKKSKGSSGKTLGNYIQPLPPELRGIVSTLIEWVQEAAPDATVSIKWAQPVFESGGPICYIRAFTGHVNFGFWRGLELSTGKELLQSGGERMAHLRITRVDELRKTQVQAWVREAVRLNSQKGDPTKRK